MRLKVSNVCQLLDKSKYPATQTINGVTFTNNGDGTITLDGTATANIAYDLTDYFSIDMNHKYIVLESNSGTGNRQAFISTLLDDNRSRYGGYYPSNGIFKFASYNGMNPIKAIGTFYAVSGETFTNRTISNFMLFDLTEMYGAGHEPTTVAQFRQDFPNEMYGYSPECWKKFRRLKYVTETKNLFDINKLTAYTPETLPKGTAGVYNGVIISRGRIDDTTCSTGKTLRQLCPDLIVGETYTLNFETTVPSSVGGQYESIHLRGSGNWWRRQRKIITESDLSAVVYIYAETDGAVYMTYNLQIEKGSTATPYQPYGYLPLNRGKYIANKEPVQLLDKTKYRGTFVNNGITYTNNGNGTFTLNGTTTSASGSSIYPSDSSANIVKANHKYLMLGFPIAFDGNNYVYFQYYPFNTSIKYYILNNANGYLFFTPADDGDRWNIFYNLKTVGFTINNITVKPQLFDLTTMYGAGNEPTTVAQFRADYPNELYDYNPYNAITFR